MHAIAWRYKRHTNLQLQSCVIIAVFKVTNSNATDNWDKDDFQIDAIDTFDIDSGAGRPIYIGGLSECGYLCFDGAGVFSVTLIHTGTDGGKIEWIELDATQSKYNCTHYGTFMDWWTTSCSTCKEISKHTPILTASGKSNFVCSAKFELAFPLVLITICIRILNGLYPY